MAQIGLTTGKSQPTKRGARANRFDHEKKSTPHFGRVGYGKFPCVSFKDLPEKELRASRGFTSEIEVFLIFAIIGFLVAIN
jgi:hypothetical protein